MNAEDRAVSFDEFRRRVLHAPLGLIGSSPDKRTFSLLLRGRYVDGVAVNHLSGSEHTVEYHSGTAPVSDDPAEPTSTRLVHLQLEGTSTLSQNGETVLLRPGDVTLSSSAHPFTLRHEGESLILRAPSRELRLEEGLVDELLGVRLDRERPLVGALHPLARQLSKSLDADDDPVATRIVEAAVSMVGAIVVETARESAHTSRRVELDAVLNYIEKNLSRPELSVAEIAAANFMSPRKLHALFELHETTVAAWVRSRRLHHCRRELADSACAGLTIAQIAARWGFTDAAHFSRAFTDRFGSSPRAFRTASTRASAVRPGSDAPPAPAFA